MGFFDKLKGKKQEKAHSYGVCIPLHEQEKKEPEGLKPVKPEMLSTSFEVDGYYQSRSNAMVRGIVKKGIVTAKKKAFIGGKEFQIMELRQDQTKVKALGEGESGSLFLKGKGIPIHGGMAIEIK
ncbi:MAG: hypothetical protein V1493_01360 [Candidatus Diapherotrites archaeon]